MTRTAVAQRVIRKAQYLVKRHESGNRVEPLMLDWAMAVVRFNCPARARVCEAEAKEGAC